MRNAKGISIYSRLAAFALALLLCLAPLATLAEAPVNPVDFILSWQADDGTPMQSVAVPVAYPEFPGSYWLYADAQAVAKDATLGIADNFSQYPGGFSIQNNLPLSQLPWMDAGLSPAMETALRIDAFDAQGAAIASYMLFISAQTPTPEAPQPPVIDATVTVSYVDRNMQPVASQTSRHFDAAGEYTVSPEPVDLPEGYTLAPDYPAQQQVYVDANGANPAAVQFVYDAPQPQAQPADITVRYLDQNGQEIAPSQTKTLNPGENVVYPELMVLPEGYTPLDVEPRTVVVDLNGANPSVVEFRYSKAIDAAVTVNYLNTNREPVASPREYRFNAEGAQTIYAEPYDLQAGYVLAQGQSDNQTVQVSAAGADPNVIEFIYELPAIDAAVTVNYLNTNREPVASPREYRFDMEGQQTIYAEPQDLQAGYVLAQGQSDNQTVSVTREGANPNVIEFYYELPAIDAAVTVNYLNANREPVASPREYRFSAEGDQTIYAEPQDLQAGYVLAQGQSDNQTVTITREGANPNVIEFYYELPAIDVPVTVNYLNINREPVASPREYRFSAEGNQTIYAEPQDLQVGYVLAQGQSDNQTVNITREGANPNVIEFIYELPAIDVPVTVNYLDANGEPVATAREYRFSAEGDQTIPAEPQDLREGYVLTEGQTVPQTVTITRAGAEPASISYYYEIPAPVIAPPVDITVYAVDDQGNPLSERTQTVVDGTNAIEAEIIDGYQLIGESTQYVQVTVNGAEPASITFTYQKTETPQETMPPSPRVEFIRVSYQDEAGHVLYETQAKCVEGEETHVQVDLSQINQDLYELNDVAEKTATVSAEGVLDPAEIVFLFTSKPQPVTAQVTLYYQTQDGQQVAETEQRVLTRTGTNTLTPRDDIPQGYTLTGEASVNIEVAQDGTATPAEFTFVYAAAAPSEAPAPEYQSTPLENVYVHPHKDGMNVRSTPEITSGEPSNILGQVAAADVLQPAALVIGAKNEEWYLIEYQGAAAYIKKSVTVEMTPAQVEEALGITLPTETEPTAAPLPNENTVVNLWGETNDTQVNLRDKPSKAGNSLLSLKQGTQLWVQSQVINDASEAWYEAIVNGKAGFIMAKYVTLYDQAKSDSISAGLPTPPPAKETATPEPTEAPTATPTPTTAPADTPTPTPTVTPTPDAAAENTPTPTPTLAPTATPTAMPEAYLGYLLTTAQTALRTGANMQDESILANLPAGTLLKALAQTYVDGKAWHHVDVYSGGATRQSGFVQDSAVTRISPTDADQYLKTATPEPAPVVTQAPPQMTGYAVTLGDNVMLREYADPIAKISKILNKDTIVMVNSQEYVMGTAWHLVSYSGLYGYIRADQLRMLSAQETQTYLSSLRRTEPPIRVTPEPVTPSSLSSYGYVNTDKVRLRKEATTNSSVVKMMNRNDFALVLGTVKTSDGGDWYHISQSGTEGYVMGRYLNVLKIGELEQFLKSNEFKSSNNLPSGTGTTGGTTAITPVEDHNKTVWQNPNIQTSYEPFNPIATATPPVEAIMSPAPTGTGGSFVVDESPTVEPLTTFEPMGTEVPVKKSSGGAGTWIAIGLLGVLGGGGYYGWKLYQENQRRAAQRAAQRRQQAARQAASPTTTAGRPGVQPQQGAQARPGQSGQQPYAPPRGPQPQGTTAYRPITQPQPGQTPAQGGTTAYKPVTPPQPGQTPAQGGTTAYKPVTQSQPGQTPAQGGTTAYRPVTQPQPGQTPAQGGTTAYKPVTQPQPGQTPAQGGTTAYKPVTQPQPGQTPAQGGTTTYKPVTQSQPGQSASGSTAAPETGSAQGNADQGQRSAGARRRRADRHLDDDKD